MVDAAGGMIIDKLIDLGMDENTIVIWTADHGDGLASHGGQFDKGTYVTEEVMRVPLAICWPEAISPHQTINEIICNIDLAPTIGADLNVMERDAKIVRKNKPYVLVNCKTDQGVEQVAQHIIHDVLFDEPPKNMLTSVKR